MLVCWSPFAAQFSFCQLELVARSMVKAEKMKSSWISSSSSSSMKTRVVVIAVVSAMVLVIAIAFWRTRTVDTEASAGGSSHLNTRVMGKRAAKASRGSRQESTVKYPRTASIPFEEILEPQTQWELGDNVLVIVVERPKGKYYCDSIASAIFMGFTPHVVCWGCEPQLPLNEIDYALFELQNVADDALVAFVNPDVYFLSHADVFWSRVEETLAAYNTEVVFLAEESCNVKSRPQKGCQDGRNVTTGGGVIRRSYINGGLWAGTGKGALRVLQEGVRKRRWLSADHFGMKDAFGSIFADMAFSSPQGDEGRTVMALDTERRLFHSVYVHDIDSMIPLPKRPSDSSDNVSTSPLQNTVFNQPVHVLSFHGWAPKKVNRAVPSVGAFRQHFPWSGRHPPAGGEIILNGVPANFSSICPTVPLSPSVLRNPWPRHYSFVPSWGWLSGRFSLWHETWFLVLVVLVALAGIIACCGFVVIRLFRRDE